MKDLRVKGTSFTVTVNYGGGYIRTIEKASSVVLTQQEKFIRLLFEDGNSLSLATKNIFDFHIELVEND